MKHKPVLIKGEELKVRLVMDSWASPEIADALCLETKKDSEGFDLVEWTAEALNAWWKVTWPEHVISASFDSDADYSEIRPEDYDAYVKDGAIVYGEVN